MHRRSQLPITGLLATVLASLTLVTPSIAFASTAAVSYNISQCGNNTNRVLLSFDDWPYGNPLMLRRMAQQASALDVGLMLFPLGQQKDEYQQATGINLADVARANGMYVGNHTYDHLDLTTLNDRQVRQEIRDGTLSTWLRPPYGAYNQRVTNIAASLGYRMCTWTMDTRDWTGKSPSEIRNFILAHVQPGSVVLMHMQWHAFNPYQLRKLVGALHDRNLKLCRPWHNPDGSIGQSPVYLPKSLPC